MTEIVQILENGLLHFTIYNQARLVELIKFILSNISADYDDFATYDSVKAIVF